MMENITESRGVLQGNMRQYIDSSNGKSPFMDFSQVLVRLSIFLKEYSKNSEIRRIGRDIAEVAGDLMKISEKYGQTLDSKINKSMSVLPISLLEFAMKERWKYFPEHGSVGSVLKDAVVIGMDLRGTIEIDPEIVACLDRLNDMVSLNFDCSIMRIKIPEYSREDICGGSDRVEEQMVDSGFRDNISNFRAPGI